MSSISWADFQARHHVGDVVQGTVTKVVPFGAFVEVDGFDGLLVDRDSPAEGTVVSARILGIDPDQTRFSLTAA
ncbi:S1 RNA-binding domain-containing protein [Luedemannella flava]|uniref:S1 RNA-binding domain-containing protein n=1 Tax=Luedemannella flava TaxID=349316 RepID=A0ABP4XS36_9ACTN